MIPTPGTSPPAPDWWTDQLVAREGGSRRPVLLELGCGPGERLARAQERGWEVYGVDPDRSLLEAADPRLAAKTCLVTGLHDLPPLAPDLVLVGPTQDPGETLEKLAARGLLGANTEVLLLLPPGSGPEQLLQELAERDLEAVGFEALTGAPEPAVRLRGFELGPTRARLAGLRRQLERSEASLAAAREREDGLRHELRRLLTEQERLHLAPSFQVYNRLRGAAAPLAPWLAPPLRRLRGGLARLLRLPGDLAQAWELSAEPVWDPVARTPRLIHPPGRCLRQLGQALGTGASPHVYQAPAPEGTSRPRVLHALANLHVGGSTQLVVDLLRGLHQGYRQSVLTGSPGAGVAYPGMEIHLEPRPARLDELRWLLREGGYDLLHLHYWGGPDEPWYQAVLAAAEAEGVPILLNVNTPTTPCVSPRIRRLVHVSAWLREHFPDPQGEVPSRVIHPGIERTRFEALAERPQEEKPRDVVGLCYRLEPDKLDPQALDGVIELVRQRPRTQVLVIGRGSLLPGFLQRTRDAGVRAHFDFVGAVPYAELPAWYRRMTVFLAPVSRESFGQVVPFAMAAGLPVVARPVGALPEILGPGAPLARTPEQQAEALAALLDDPDRAHELGGANARRARELFAVEDMVGAYREVYRELLGGRR